MAYRKKAISNPATGQEIRFLQTSRDTNGQLLEMEATWRARSIEPAPHYHPYQEEVFTVLSGEMTIRVGNGSPRILKMGDMLHISRGQVHSMWNASPFKARMNWQVRPALDTEYLLETITGLAADGKTKHSGMPPLLQTALIASRFSKELRLAKPPLVVQTIVFGILSLIARLRGYKSEYGQYLD